MLTLLKRKITNVTPYDLVRVHGCVKPVSQHLVLYLGQGLSVFFLIGMVLCFFVFVPATLKHFLMALSVFPVKNNGLKVVNKMSVFFLTLSA